ncbi:probable cytochrome P450 6a14 [Chironomus tepperi]|uniref:probable cytochrome P450 6a14 n=1 Tax=Chironomus tepperi TaxID=113505 RepID=UPI00391F0575
MELVSTITLLIVLAVTIYGYLLHQYSYWKRRNIPYIEPHLIYGNAKGVESKIHHTQFWIDTYQKLKSKGPVAGLYVYFFPVAIVTDLDVIKQILIKDFNIFPNRGHYLDAERDPISAHFVNVEDDQWRFLRNKLSPAFSSGKLKSMFPTILKTADKFIEVARANNSLDVRDLGARFASDVLGSVGFGIECNAMTTNDSQYHQIATNFMDNLHFLSKTFLECNRKIFKFLRFSSIDDVTRTFYTTIVDKMLEYREENSVNRTDLLNFMIHEKDSSRKLTRMEMAAQTAVFLVAGHEVIVSMLSHCLYELSMRKDLQENARNSVKEVLNEFDGEFSYESVYKMKYVEQCILETVRKYFISFSCRREASQDYKIPNTDNILEKGTLIQFPVFAIHHDPDIYPEPDRWDPDRFSTENVESRHKFAFLAFGEGPRMCIGRRLGILILKAMLAKFLMSYDFEIDRNKTSVPIKHCVKRLFLTPENGIHININKIDLS